MTQRNMFERRKDLGGVTVINTVLPWVPISVIEEDDGSGFRQSGRLDFCYTIFINNLSILP